MYLTLLTGKARVANRWNLRPGAALLLPFLMFALVLSGCQPIVLPGSDATTIQSFDAAWNAHDVDAVLAFFTDDAVITPVPPLPGGPEKFTGREEIRGFIQLLMPGFRVKSENIQVSGTTVTWWFAVYSDFFQSLGVNPVTGMGEAVLDQGKFRSFVPRFSQETVNKLLALREEAEIESGGNLALIDELFAPEFQLHFPGFPPMDREGYKQLLAGFRAGFPDLEVTVAGQVAEGSMVANRLVIRGTHTGEFQGIPPTGSAIEVTGMNVMRFENGKIVELWGVPDLLGILQQIGAIPAPGQN
ncbi:ester cyclase [Litorilinea aerophila]|nr:ester cyclase [Litorilinea aerophila]MCC9075552.1 ester cyclase [Litorilinea aerophila]